MKKKSFGDERNTVYGQFHNRYCSEKGNVSNPGLNSFPRFRGGNEHHFWTNPNQNPVKNANFSFEEEMDTISV